MSRPSPHSSGQYSGNAQLQPSSGTTGSQQLSGRGTSSGPASSGYSGYSTGGQSATATTYSQPGYPSSGTVGTPGGPPPHSSFCPSPGQYYAPTPAQQQQQPVSGSSTYAPPSSMVGAGGYMSSNSGGGVLGMQPAVYTSSNSTYSGAMPSQHQMPGMYAASMMAPDGVSSYPAAMGGYPAMGPVGSTPLPPHGPMSSMGPVMGPHGMVMPGMDPAAAQDEAQRLAGGLALEGKQVRPGGGGRAGRVSQEGSGMDDAVADGAQQQQQL